MADDKPTEDVLYCGPVIDPDGTQVCVRARGGSIEPAFLTPGTQPRPEGSLAVALTPRSEPNAFDLEEVQETFSDRSGPAQVNSERYRSGWDRIFGSRTVGVA